MAEDVFSSVNNVARDCLQTFVSYIDVSQHIMLYEFRKGVSVGAAQRNISYVYGDRGPALRMVKKWFGRFRLGDFNLEDQPHSGRPSIIGNDILCALVKENPKITTEKIAQRLEIGVLHEVSGSSMYIFHGAISQCSVTMVKYLSSESLRKPNFSSMNSDASDDKNLDSNGDFIFDPPAEMMIHDYDDERTIEEEEALESNEDPQVELSNLQREGEMPLSELLAMYGYNDNDNDSESEDLVSNPDTNVDKDLKDPLQADGQSDVCLEENHETEQIEEEPSELVKLYTEMPGGEVIDDAGGTSRLLRSVSRPQSEEEEDDCDYSPDEEEWKKTIMVGSDYQAKIPVGMCKYDDALPYENDDKMLWDPSPLTEKETEEFLIKAHESLLNNAHVPAGIHIKDDEQALYLLLQCGYNVEEALRRRRINAVPPADTMSIWSEEECRNFETGMRMYGKDFHTIQKNKVRTRSVGELVQFYYLWKKTERHDVYAHKSRLEKKKYSLHPGITDYMDRFLEEQEVGSGHQDRSSSPNLHLLLYSDSKKHSRMDETEQTSPAVDPLGGFVGHFGKENMKSFVKLSATSELPVVAVDARDHEPQHAVDKKTPLVITLDEDDYSEASKE